jgi:hypothetical protein
VHERPDIVRGQIENINYFCPGSLIVIHISAGATASRDEFERFCDFENVFINPDSYDTVWSAGIMHTHISNFIHVLNLHEDFDKFVLISSNELFVKHGLQEFISQYEIGTQMEVYDPATDWGVFRQDFLESPEMQGFLSALELPLFFGGQAEGQFASKKIFAHVTKHYIANFPMGPFGFPLEEVILPTVAARYSMTGTDAALPITFCNYCNNADLSPELIDHIIKGTGTIFARRVPRALRSPHIGESVLRGVFSVKRVPREDCELRRYIFSLMV